MTTYLTLNNLMWEILKKREQGKEGKRKKDIVIIIYGKVRSGKSTLGLRCIDTWLKFKNLELKEKHPTRVIENEKVWSELFKNNFAGSAEDAIDKIKNISNKSTIFVDEGIDVASSRKIMTSEVSNLTHLLEKTGSKQLFTILITPSYKLFSKDLFARAHYLFHIPGEPTEKGSYANVLVNYQSPILAEINPFGLKNLFSKAEKLKTDESVMRLIYRSRCYVGDVAFHEISSRIYGLYEKMVKEPQQNKLTYQSKFISYNKYFKIWYAYANMLYNLQNGNEVSRAQLVRDLGYDKFGNKVLTDSQIKNAMDAIKNMEKNPMKK